MAELDRIDETLALLSVAIGSIMEDEADAAVMALPTDKNAVQARFSALAAAGRDIVTLAAAAEVLLRRRG